MAKVEKIVTKMKTKPVDFTLCITVLLLLALGIVMVLSASSPAALSESGNSYTYVSKQALSAAIGLVAMAIISKIDYHKYKPLYKLAYIGSVALLALVPIIGEDINGAKRWINLGPLRFFPAFRACKNRAYCILCSLFSRPQRRIENYLERFCQTIFMVSTTYSNISCISRSLKCFYCYFGYCFCYDDYCGNKIA